MTDGWRMRCWGLLLAATLLPGCAASYLLRAGVEEAKFLWRRQAIQQILDTGRASPETAAKLRLVLRAREYAARELGLAVGGSYSAVAEVGDEPVVYVVTAAPRYRLVPHTWWFPIVGRVPYKGFFELADARAEAARLEGEDFDALVRPSGAFSTLGWFDDPLPSNLLKLDEVALVSLVFHELLHNTRYFPGSAAFAESFANFVGQRAAIAFLAADGDTARAAQARDEWREDLAYSAFLVKLVSHLEAAYRQPPSRAQREALFDVARAELAALGLRTHDWQGRVVNNAVVVHERLYYQRLELFDAVLVRQGGDLRRAIATIVATTDGAADPFAATATLVPASAP